MSEVNATDYLAWRSAINAQEQIKQKMLGISKEALSDQAIMISFAKLGEEFDKAGEECTRLARILAAG